MSDKEVQIRLKQLCAEARHLPANAQLRAYRGFLTELADLMYRGVVGEDYRHPEAPTAPSAPPSTQTVQHIAPAVHVGPMTEQVRHFGPGVSHRDVVNPPPAAAIVDPRGMPPGQVSVEVIPPGKTPPIAPSSMTVEHVNPKDEE